MSDFKKAIEVVILTHEGGYQNRPDDPGNWTPDGVLKGTRFGISAATFPNEDIEGMTLNRAEDLYRQRWGMFSLLSDQRILTKVLDLAVNMENGGHGPATVILQDSVNALGGVLLVDGKFGPKTADAANAIDPGQLLPQLCKDAEAHYIALEAKRPQMKAWFATWNGRAAWIPPLEQTA